VIAKVLTAEEELQKLRKLIVDFRKANLLTQARVRSEEFWSTADAADIDEIDLEESLAMLAIFDVADDLIDKETPVAKK
jgi:hypothetical protein